MVKKIFKKVLQIIPFIFFALSFFLVIQVILAVKNEQTPTLFGYSMLHIKTGSMEDTIMTNDLIFINTKATEFEVEDIISFHKIDEPSIIITHRIIAIDIVNGEKLYTTLGDNNSISGGFEIQFPESLIIGKYVSKSTFLGSMYQLVSDGGINLIYGVVVLIFVLIGVTEGANIVKEISKQKKEVAEEDKQKLIESLKIKLREDMERQEQTKEE